MTLRSSPLAAIAALCLAAAALPAPPDSIVRLVRRIVDVTLPAQRTVPVLFPDTHPSAVTSGSTLSTDRN